MTREELIERLQAAPEGSRELDGDIGDAIGLTGARTEQIGRMAMTGHWTRAAMPRFTTSVDAALRLVPKGAEYSISTLYGVADVEVGLNFADRPSGMARRADCNVVLALCEAALKAGAQPCP